MQQVLVTDLISQIRVMSGLRGNQYFTDENICKFMTDANQELHDEFQKANEHHLMSSFDFTLTGNGEGDGLNSVEVPDDFIQGHTVSGGMDLDEQDRYRVHTLPNWLQRHDYKYGYRPRYFIRGRILEMYPASLAAGSYRLWYTARAEVLALPVTRTITANAFDTPIGGGIPGPGSWAIANGAFGSSVPEGGAMVFSSPIPEDGSAIITMSLLAPNTAYNSTYFINGVNSATLISITVDASAGFTLPSAGTYELTYQPIGTVGQLPPAITPYAEFIKLHTSIAIRHGQELSASDLEQKLERKRHEIKGNVANKTEEPSQPPLERGNGWDNMIGAWGEPGNWG